MDGEGMINDRWEGVVGQLVKANYRANHEMENKLTKLLMSLHE